MSRGPGVLSRWLRRLRRTGPPVPGPFPDDTHPERLALLPYCERGRGVDLGCGHRKTSPNCIGVDLIPPGEAGQHGVVKGRMSVADIVAPADDLPMFAAASLDFVVSLHVVEHLLDPVKAWQEWRRLLRPGGVCAHVVPDESARPTVPLDPTHRHAYTPESLARLVGVIGGFRVERVHPVISGWSFLCVARRVDEAASARPPGA